MIPHEEGEASREGGEIVADYVAGKAWKQERKQHIMDAAFRLFAEKGIICL